MLQSGTPQSGTPQSGTPQSGAGNTYRLVDPTTGTATQHGGSLSESAASVIQYMVMRYGLPALRAHLERLRNSDIQLNGTTDGGARREYMLMELTRWPNSSVWAWEIAL